MSSKKPEWEKDGEDWTVTVNGTTYRATYEEIGKPEYYVRGGTLSGDHGSLDSALRGILDHEAGRCNGGHTHLP